MSGGRLPRSYLYAPGNRPDLIPKAWSGAAEAVIVDLEDAVPLAEKDAARAQVAAWAAGVDAGSGPELWVRVNPGPTAAEDVAAMCGAPLTGVVLAKATATGVEELTALIRDQGDDWRVSPLLETAGAVLEAPRIAGLPGVTRMQLGEYDLCAELGVVPGEDERELDWARAQVVVASSAAGIAPPVAPVSIEVEDTALFRERTVRARRQGFFGRACIHPAQLETVHDAFTPSPEEVAAARDTLRLLAEAEERGHGTVLDDAGRLVDEATIRTARRVLGLV
ncbi:CoA ester lyase [Marmoricola endophyticus]|uniref:CoA ester lyase n=1 Tax=Marmoricola endophyticus TaxID=2040280 RepID=A0A917BPP9_9ACTN|nr:CoA ester lyase [Marmoricola endophyticus]GGF53061.1 CoA ester lyase [Marmoricola endophyticus]